MSDTKTLLPRAELAVTVTRSRRSSKRCLIILIIFTIAGLILYSKLLGNRDTFILSRTETTPPSKKDNAFSKKDNFPPKPTSFVKGVSKAYQENLETVDKIVSDRMSNITSYCDETHYMNYGIYNTYNFPEVNILWVPSFKAGSSTWRDYLINLIKVHKTGPFSLNQLSGRHLEVKDYTQVGGRRKLKPSVGAQDKAVSFMQVRHPIDRLISLHISTGGLKSDSGSLKSWGMQAIIEGREVPDNMNMSAIYKKELKTRITKRHDMYLLVDDAFIEEAQSHASPDNPYFRPPSPTFHELVAYIIKRRFTDHNSYNGHWYPASEWGDVCQNNLKFVIKLENNPLETLFILNKTNLLSEADAFLHKHNPSNVNKDADVVLDKGEVHDVRASDPSKYREWMAMLSAHQKSMLKKIYREDFRLFNYDDSMLD